MKTILALTLLVGCGGATFQAKAPAAPMTDPVAASAETARFVNASIACFTSGVWDDLQGDRPDSCTVLAVEAIGAKPADASTRAAVRAIDPRAVDKIVKKLGDEQASALVRAVADASREALNARHAAERIRKAGGDAVQVDADDAALAAHGALGALGAMKSQTAQVVTLVLAADHLENVRGLPARAKLAAAAPSFEVLFGVARPAYYVPGAWLGFVSDAARAGGYEAEAGGTAHDREQAAFAGVASGLARRFELAAKTSEGEAKTVATEYAKRLQLAVADKNRKSVASK